MYAMKPPAAYADGSPCLLLNWLQTMIHWFSLLLAFGVALWLVPGQAVLAEENPSAPDELQFSTPQPIAETPQVWIPTSRFTSGPHVRYAFRDVVRDTIAKTVRVRSAGQDAALGGIVGADGWILTKASCLGDQLSCQFSGGREIEARVVGINRNHDLAMLKVSAKRLPILELSHETSLQVGHWVATVSTEPSSSDGRCCERNAARNPAATGDFGRPLRQQ